MQLIKPVTSYNAASLTFTIKNFSQKGKTPDMWKIAMINPIPKIRMPEQLSDYRSIHTLHYCRNVREFGSETYCWIYQKRII